MEPPKPGSVEAKGEQRTDRADFRAFASKALAAHALRYDKPKEKLSLDFTRNWITASLLFLLLVTSLSYYGFTLWALFKIDDAALREAALDKFTAIHGAVFPALTGLLGAAIAFYFTKGKD